MPVRNSWFLFLFPFSLYLLLFLILRFEYSQFELHKFINQKIHPGPDNLFKILSNSVEGFFIVFLLIVSFLIDKKLVLKLVLVFAFYGILTVFFKRIVFPDMMRPSYFFTAEDIFFIDNFTLHKRYSFPSGHSAEVYALGVFTISIFKQKWVSFLMGILCVSVAFSRVYLSQHFIEDTVAGAVLGIICAIVGIYIYEKYGLPYLLKKQKTVVSSH